MVTRGARLKIHVVARGERNTRNGFANSELYPST